MNTEVLIILILAVVIVIIVALILNRGRLKRLGIKAGNEGFEVETEMTETDPNSKTEEGKSKIVAKKIHQKGKRDEISIDGEDVTAKNIKQDGDDNKITIGKK